MEKSLWFAGSSDVLVDVLQVPVDVDQHPFQFVNTPYGSFISLDEWQHLRSQQLANGLFLDLVEVVEELPLQMQLVRACQYLVAYYLLAGWTLQIADEQQVAFGGGMYLPTHLQQASRVVVPARDSELPPA